MKQQSYGLAVEENFTPTYYEMPVIVIHVRGFWYLHRLLKRQNTCKYSRVIIISDIQAHLLNSEIRQVVPCNLKNHVFLVIFTVLLLLTLVVYD